MSNKITAIGVTEWMGRNWFAMFMINPPLWLTAHLGVPRFPRLWYSRSVMSQPRFELGLCLHSFDRAWFASHVTTLGSLVFTPTVPLKCDWLSYMPVSMVTVQHCQVMWQLMFQWSRSHGHGHGGAWFVHGIISRFSLATTELGLLIYMENK